MAKKVVKKTPRKTSNLPVVRNKSYNIASPKEMTSMAVFLKSYVVKQKLYTPIKGKNYVHVEGWQFAGGLMGLFPRVVEVTDLSNSKDKLIKWLVKVEIYNFKTDKVVGIGYALCSNKESKKSSFDEYAILSMAQTRAIGKAYRNIVGWVMKLAGYEATPSEEMTKVGQTPPPTPSKEDLDNYIECDGACGAVVSPESSEFSKKKYRGKVFCRECQELKKK